MLWFGSRNVHQQLKARRTSRGTRSINHRRYIRLSTDLVTLAPSGYWLPSSAGPQPHPHPLHAYCKRIVRHQCWHRSIVAPCPCACPDTRVANLESSATEVWSVRASRAKQRVEHVVPPCRVARGGGIQRQGREVKDEAQRLIPGVK